MNNEKFSSNTNRMKKKIFLYGILPFLLCALAIIIAPIVQAYTIDDGMVITADEIDNAKIGVLDLDIKDTDISASTLDLCPKTATVKLFGFIPIRTVEVNLLANKTVTAGGQLLGFDLQSGGVEILGFNSVLTREGEKNPIKDIGLKKQDIITKINGKEVKTLDDIDRILNGKNKGKEVQIDYTRGDKTFTAVALPQRDLLSGKYKLGIWVKNSTNGIGTLTYVKSDGRYGAVGHPISENRALLEHTQSGEVYETQFIGVVKGEKNAPGEIKATIEFSKGEIGDIDTNSNYGLFGQRDKEISGEQVTLGGRFSVKPGKAYIRTQVSKDGVKDYEIKIIKTSKQKKASEKSIVFKVVDKELLSLTNGIVQGMSGSPIIQNGKMVGSVTHVFLNDPTHGYGVYIDWMIEQ